MQHARTIAMATTLLADGRAEDVVDMVDPLIEPVTAPASSTGQILLRGLMARIEIAHRNHPDRVFELLPEVEEVSGLCTCVRAEVTLWRGWAHARRATSGDAARAVRLLKESQELFVSINDPLGRCWALLGRAQAYFAGGEYGLMRCMLDDASALLDRLRDTQAERWLHELRVRTRRSAGRYAEAEQHVQALHSIADNWDDRHVRGAAAAYSAALQYDRGASPSRIIERAKTAVSVLRQVDLQTPWSALTAVQAHVGALCRHGSWQEAYDVIDEAEEMLSDDPVTRAYLRLLRARTAVRLGEMENAGALLAEFLDRSRSLPPGFQRSDVALLHGEILAHRDCLDEAEPWMERAYRHARETGDRDTAVRSLLRLARLAAAQDRTESARSRLDAAQEYEDLFQAVPHAARRLFVEGAVAETEGQRAEAYRTYRLAYSAAAMMGDRSREAALAQWLDEVDGDGAASLRSVGIGTTFETLGTGEDLKAVDTTARTKRAAEKSEETFDASFSDRLARAALSVPLVAETWLQKVGALVPADKWMGICRATDNPPVFIHERGPRPDGFVTPSGEPGFSSNGAIQWVPIPGQTSVEFFFGVETSADELRQSLERDVEGQLQSWLSVLGLALDRASVRAEPPAFSSTANPAARVEGFVAESSAMQALTDEIRRIQRSRSPVLLTGERGTGKHVVARAIHETSERADCPLEQVSCAPTQTEEPLETRLFGAVDDGRSGKTGAVHAAEGGTLVIEDVDALPLSVQSSLLHLLQTGHTRPGDGAGEVPADVRVIVTTTADLDARVEEGRFRAPLRNHLRGISLHVPPLRDRRADIPLLVRHFLNTFRPDESALVSITQPAMEALLRYNWPGNVRQLRNEIERALVHVQSEPAPTIELDALLDTIVESAQRTRIPQTAEDNPDTILEPNQTLTDVLSRTEKAVIERVLQACDGQITASADVLGLTRQGLYKKMKRLDIDASAFQSSSEPAPASS